MAVARWPPPWRAVREVDITECPRLVGRVRRPHPGDHARRPGARLLAGGKGAAAAGTWGAIIRRVRSAPCLGLERHPARRPRPVVTATNAAFATIGGPAVTADEHRRDFRRPVVDYYAQVMGRPVDETEFVLLDRVSTTRTGRNWSTVRSPPDAWTRSTRGTGTQSLLSMWFHDELLPEVNRRGLAAACPGRRAAGDGRWWAQGRASGRAPCGVGRRRRRRGADRRLGRRRARRRRGRRGCVLYAGGFTDPRGARAYRPPIADTLLEAVRLAAL